MMELTDLRIFIAVAENGSISRAAAALQLAQPSVSQRIQHLEDEVALQLFERHRRGVRLTSAGEVLLNHAKRSLDVLADGLETMKRDQTSRLHIRLCGPSSVNSFMLTPLVHALVQAGHTVHLHDAHSYEVLQSVLDGTSDVGFILSERPIPPGIRAQVVWHDPILAVVSSVHRLAGTSGSEQHPLPLTKLSDCTLIQYRFSSEVDRFWHELTTRVGQPLQPVISATPVEAVKSLIDTGEYVGFLPNSTVKADIAAGRLRQLFVDGLPTAAWRVSVVVRDRKYLTPAAAAVMDKLEFSAAW